VNAPFKSPSAGLIKLADKTSNLRTIKASPPADWSPERKREYVAWATEVVEGLKSTNPRLRAEFEKARIALM
jgi:guanosine-3',5'-bis(diphosphate) 3'-pyrophosphohydrolase